MTKPVSHLLDIYDCWVHLATDRKQLATLRRKYGPKAVPKFDNGDFGGTTWFRLSPDDGPDVNHYVIVIDLAKHRGNQGEVLNTVAHEATHCAGGILENAGAEYDANSEPLAWLVGWLVRWMWTSL